MKIHYFQRYHEKENVATANTMLLLSRLYSYSSDKFFRFLKSEYFADSFDPELVFTLQEKSVDSIPDATITQEGFKIVVETKLTDWFADVCRGSGGCHFCGVGAGGGGCFRSRYLSLF